MAGSKTAVERSLTVPVEHFGPEAETFSSPLDRGIEREVLILRKHGVETFESCQGGEGHASLEPIIRFDGEYSAGFHAYSVAVAHGLKIAQLRRVYRQESGELKGPWWEMTFHPPSTDQE